MLRDYAPDRRERSSRLPRRRMFRILVAVVLVSIFVGSVVLLYRLRSSPSPMAIIPPDPLPSPAAVVSSLGKGRTFQDALAALGVSKDRVIQIVEVLRHHIDFRRLQAQDGLELHHDSDGDLVKLVYRQSPVDIVEVKREDDIWTGTRLEVPVQCRVVLVSGTLKDSLFESIERLGEQPQLVLDFAEIFAWDFDFAADSQPGDRFRMIVEKVFAEEQFVKYGRILAAEYESEGQRHTGIYFQDRERDGYYTPEGESLRRAFLKSPLEFTRISSTFSHVRRHPILGGVRPHLAVDYAAPHGTPVWAVADGTVEYVGCKGGNGSTVIIRHQWNFKTMYNHLSRFGKNVRRGVAVRQRQVIGYVGSTGLSTGPHLDYRVMKDGRFVNPLKQTFLPGLPISSSNRAPFAEARDSRLSQLHGTGVARPAK